MNESKISVRYARSLYLTASEQGVAETVGGDMRKLMELIRTSDDFRIFLESSVIRKSKKSEMLHQIFSPHVTDLTLRFLALVAENRRENWLESIGRDYLDIMREQMGITPVSITTAVELPAESLSHITRFLSQETGRRVELAPKVNPAIIGGIVLRIGDLQFDGSISRQLAKVKEELMKNPLF
ncbi:MAG TPA: ATP synthase F1 subunit delta [Prolixibacteraceae bacterium]|nr:ATP synthase F1 subunit delta [Prolixibacteraceae bacterium]